MLRRSVQRGGLYDWWRKISKPLRHGARGDPQQPFGPDFGLTIIPDFVLEPEREKIRRQYVDLMTRKSPDIASSDGRIQLPPFNVECFMPIIERLEEDQLVIPGHLNNQTVNFFDENAFIRAHVDNLFVYDDTFAIISLISPAIIRFVHMQNGEELEALIPQNSVYIMEGPARYTYFHYVPPTELLRLSIVLRRSIFRSHGTFRPVDPRMNNMLPYKANAALDALMSKEIGSVRMDVDEEWMAKNMLGAFDTAEMVRRLHPLRDWSLRQQLSEDRERYDELRAKKYLDLDLSWRFDELNETFKALDLEMAVNAEQMVAAEKMAESRRRAAEGANVTAEEIERNKQRAAAADAAAAASAAASEATTSSSSSSHHECSGAGCSHPHHRRPGHHEKIGGDS